MVPPDDPGNIRVFVHWRDQTVFAGEDIKCTITFKNVAAGVETATGTQARNASRQRRNNPDTQRLLSNLASPLGNRNKGGAAITSPPPASNGRSHRRSALSLSLPSTVSGTRSAAVQWPSAGGSFSESRPGHSHKRSLSIVSIGSNNSIDDRRQRIETPRRSAMSQRGHSRASSLQISPRGNLAAGLQPIRNMSSPLYTASYPPDRYGRQSASSTAPSTPGIGLGRSPRATPNSIPDFYFPASSPVEKPIEEENVSDSKNMALRHKDMVKPLTAARILSSNSMASGTPRSSGELYAMSNHSSETLASDYPAVKNSDRRPPHLRRDTGLPTLQNRAPESIMMGYAQVQGSFLLDGSLVSLGQFDQVKRKGLVAGRGGGVVGLDQNKRESGLLRGFGWEAISNSLGDFLGSSELSTMKEMRGAAKSKAVPLLSTPQSILFVDLQLAPGESRSYEYTLRLPRGLPPTHKGKALKTWYSLVIGTQRAGGVKEQQIRSVEIPFRVLGSVNNYGEILGHDLMNPYILLKDEAVVKAVGERKHAGASQMQVKSNENMQDFLAYVDELVTEQKKGEDDGKSNTLLSPTDGVNSRRPSVFDEQMEITCTKEAIHLAIMRSNLASEGQSQNRFEIARNGRRVGAVMLTRPAYRLGEVVTMVIDFGEAEVPCYAVHATLETTEKVDASLAVRSDSSIQRVTRRVYVGSSEATMYARRVVFAPTIPISATPEFVTSGVGFEWKIRVEFVVPAKSGEEGGGGSGSGEGSPTTTTATDHGDVGHALTPSAAGRSALLEQISRDEKGGLVLVAVENLACESFDVSVPLKVYGAVGTGLERLERDESLERGLAV